MGEPRLTTEDGDRRHREDEEEGLVVDPTSPITEDAFPAPSKARAYSDTKRKHAAAAPLYGGGVYIPPAKRLQMLQADQLVQQDTAVLQRQTWQDQKRVIHGTINRLNESTIKPLIHDLFTKVNLLRFRGVLAKNLLQAALTSTQYSSVYAALVAVLNSKLPEVGELVLKRTILAFRRHYRRKEKSQCLAMAIFMGHLFHQSVVHELLILQILTLLLDGDPTNDSVEVAVEFLTVVGQALLEVSPAGVRAVLDRLRSLLHEGHLQKRVEYKMEVLLKMRKQGFRDCPAPIPEELDLVERDDQITFELSLDDEDLTKEEQLDVFRVDDDYEESEETWTKIRGEILGLGGDSDEDGEDETDDDSDGEEEEDEEEEDIPDQELAIVPANSKAMTTITDLTEADLVHLRRQIYLTIMSSATFEECTHKLTQINIPPGRECELINMIIECCSQERTFLRYYGLIGARFCLLDDRWRDAFLEAFVTQYTTIHRLETNKLRNVAKLFAHLLHTDSMPWHCLSMVHLNEDETTSSSRIFVKILIQEMAEAIGIAKLKQRFETNDAELSEWYKGMFPRDDVRKTRYAINFFTSIGLGPLTDGLREFLKNAPKMILAQAAAAAAAKKTEDDDESSVSSSSSSSSSGSSSLSSSSGSSSSSYDSDSSSSFSSDSSASSYSRRRRGSGRRASSDSSDSDSDDSYDRRKSRSKRKDAGEKGARERPQQDRKRKDTDDKDAREKPQKDRKGNASSDSDSDDSYDRRKSRPKRKDTDDKGAREKPRQDTGEKDAREKPQKDHKREELGEKEAREKPQKDRKRNDSSDSDSDDSYDRRKSRPKRKDAGKKGTREKPPQDRKRKDTYESEAREKPQKELKRNDSSDSDSDDSYDRRKSRSKRKATNDKGARKEPPQDRKREDTDDKDAREKPRQDSKREDTNDKDAREKPRQDSKREETGEKDAREKPQQEVKRKDTDENGTRDELRHDHKSQAKREPTPDRDNTKDLPSKARRDTRDKDGRKDTGRDNEDDRREEKTRRDSQDKRGYGDDNRKRMGQLGDELGAPNEDGRRRSDDDRDRGAKVADDRSKDRQLRGSNGSREKDNDSRRGRGGDYEDRGRRDRFDDADRRDRPARRENDSVGKVAKDRAKEDGFDGDGPRRGDNGRDSRGSRDGPEDRVARRRSRSGDRVQDSRRDDADGGNRRRSRSNDDRREEDRKRRRSPSSSSSDSSHGSDSGSEDSRRNPPKRRRSYSSDNKSR